MPSSALRKIDTDPHAHFQGRSRDALRWFFRIAALWQLRPSEQMAMLGIAQSTLYKWRTDPPAALSRDVVERLSYVVGIYKALQILFPDERAADAWVKKPNAAPFFGGKSALDRMMSGRIADLYLVRQYLDAQRGGWA